MAVAILFVALINAAGSFAARAQFGGFGLPELSSAVLDRAGSATRTHLEQLKQYIANERWDEAIAVLRQVSDADSEKVIAIAPHRSVSVRQFCQQRLAALPSEALEIYRRQTDSKARRWYEQGVQSRDRQALERVVNRYFCSRYGDEALLALGEIALEAGHYDEARFRWQQMLPAEAASGDPEPLNYPDTDLPKAAIRARLVLVSIMEGSLARAREELARLRADFGKASGRLAGREANYVETLDDLLAAAAKWPPRVVGRQWLTFAGSPQRNQHAPRAIDVGAPAWTVKLPPAPQSDANTARRAGLPLMRVAETHRLPLSYYPLVTGGLVLVNTAYEVFAFDLQTGKRAWSAQSPIAQPRRDPRFEVTRNSLGTARFTMTVHGNRLYATLGPPGTTTLGSRGGELVCLDLSAEGRLIWKAETGEDELHFEGAPLCDAGHVYIAARKSSMSSASAHVICYDARNGHQQWKRYICAANSPGGGLYREITHNLLTLNDETLYFNTNLGAVAALSARDGTLRWIATYQRVTQRHVGDDYHHFYRDLTPCLYDHGRLYVAPSDHGSIFAIDAARGTMIWTTAPGAANSIVHLLGVGHGNLLASGNSLWWIDAQNGKVRRRFAEQGSMQAFGRGVLAGDKVYWPTRDKIYVAAQATPPAERPIERVIDLSLRQGGATGGNLIPAGDYLLVAGHDSIDAYSQYSRMREKNDSDDLTDRESGTRRIPHVAETSRITTEHSENSTGPAGPFSPPRSERAP